VEVAPTERAGPKLKKLLVVLAVTGLIFSLAGSTPAHDETTDRQPGGEKVERSIPVDPQVTLTLCVASGTLTVRGWDKNEVRVRSADAIQIELRRLDKTKDQSIPARRVDVVVFDKTSRINSTVDCQALAAVDMEVPAGATVQVQTRDGDISISGVAAAYAGSQNGDISIERATKLVEAGSVGGSISLRNSSGRVNLSSAGGVVEVANLRAASAEDTLEVGTVSGDIQLEGVSNPRVMAKTVNGNVMMTGPLAKAGNYAFTNMAGDVLLALPHDASFQLNAKVSERRDLVSDFALTYLGETPPTPPSPPSSPGRATKPGAAAKPGPVGPPGTPAPGAKGQPAPKTGPVIAPVAVEKPTAVAPYVLRRVQAICGSGDATISVASFGGTVRLKKI
jgi:DUF4097 and DUF4098 domain-containing protein YvlB